VHVGGGAAQSSFMADTDLPLISDDLFVLGLKWRTLAARGFNYSEEKAAYWRRETGRSRVPICPMRSTWAAGLHELGDWASRKYQTTTFRVADGHGRTARSGRSRCFHSRAHRRTERARFDRRDEGHRCFGARQLRSRNHRLHAQDGLPVMGDRAQFWINAGRDPASLSLGDGEQAVRGCRG
jgi:hypothetical protein